MRRTSSRTLAATSLLALLTALAVPNRAGAEERANHATTVRMVRDSERDVVRIVVGFHEIPTFTARLEQSGLRPGQMGRVLSYADSQPFNPKDPLASENRRLSILALRVNR